MSVYESRILRKKTMKFEHATLLETAMSIFTQTKILLLFTQCYYTINVMSLELLLLGK